jgi:hypothetical protein
VGVLPIYLSSFEALPPGSWYLESTDVKAFVGPFLPFELLEKMGEGMSHSDAERMVIALCQRVVEALRDGEGTRVEEFVKELLAKAPTERSSREAVSVAGGSPLPGKEG